MFKDIFRGKKSESQVPPMKIFNNITDIVRDDLQKTIKKNGKVSVAAVCFSMYAYQELKQQLDQIDEFRFIFTSPTFVKEKAEKQKREFYIPRLHRENSLYGTEFEIKLRNELTQRAIAKECANWIKTKAKFKSNTTGENMSGFMTVDSDLGQFAYVPINGFTTVDIGRERGNNSYNMVQGMEAPFSLQYMQLFDALWNDNSKMQDITDMIIENISNAYNENSPEFIYFMTLYHVFSEFLEDISEDTLPNEATGFKQSQIWNKLYGFQKDAVLAIINKLEKYNGCILSDSVGLGKTFTALAVIKYYENRNKSVLVLEAKKRTTDALLRMLDFDFFEVLDSVTIARSRKHIMKYYNTAEIGKFPVRLRPISKRPSLADLDSAINYNQIYEQLMLLSLCIYTPTNYIFPSKLEKYIDMTHHKGTNLTQVGREQGIQRLMSINLLKRLESSVYSFNLTLKRIYELINTTLKTIDEYEKNGKTILEAYDVPESELDIDDSNSDLFTVGKKVKIDLSDMDYRTWRNELQKDADTLELLLLMMKDITPKHDAKLQTLFSILDKKMAHPINKSNKKVLIFSAFSDTAEYLYDNVSKYMKDKEKLHGQDENGISRSDRTEC